MNIVLTGFMGTGKTAVGRSLAGKLGWKFIDTDDIIEEKQKMKIADIFKKHGEKYFRDVEAGVIAGVSGYDRHVISTGGGVVLREENMSALESNGVIINLEASPETILFRTGAGKDRPLLNVTDPLSEILTLLKTREPFYGRCSFRINTDKTTPEQAADTAMDLLKGSLNKINGKHR